MSQDVKATIGGAHQSDLAVIDGALSTMSAAQLEDLRAAARRLGHLPFPQLVQALFDQETAGRMAAGRGQSQRCGQDRGHIAAEESEEGIRSPFVERLLAQIEEALAAKNMSN